MSRNLEGEKVTFLKCYPLYPSGGLQDLQPDPKAVYSDLCSVENNELGCKLEAIRVKKLQVPNNQKHHIAL